MPMSSFLVLLLGSIPLTSWGWLWAQSSFILGLLKTCFACFIYFIRSLMPSNIISHTPWSNYSRPNTWINMVPFPLIVTLVFALYSKRLFRSTKGICPPWEIYDKQLVFSLGKVLLCLLCSPFTSLLTWLFIHFSLSMFDFGKNWWV
jgi:hypothetical protein